MRWNKLMLLVALVAVATGALLPSPAIPPARAQGNAHVLGYEPADSRWLDLIQGSPLALSGDAVRRLARDGFAISGDGHLSFAAGYDQVYVNDLPLYITVDSVLHAMHRSFDELLMSVEARTLWPALSSLLGDLRAALREGALDAYPAEVRADIDEYLAVALALLTNGEVVPVAGGDIERIRYFARLARAAEGMQEDEIFGTTRYMDYSQFRPRGHYEGHMVLDRYFRAMMWLGRVDARLAQVTDQGTLVLDRRQTAVALALSELVELSGRTGYDGIRGAIDAFVGRPDSMTPTEAEALKTALGVADGTELDTLSDEQILAAIVAGGFGAQAINAHGVVAVPGDEPTPLAPSFLLFGQAYIIDSEVFGRVVYDRFSSPEPRLMPQPLDVAATVLGNDTATRLLAAEIAAYPGLEQRLAELRAFVDGQDPSLWDSSLYNGWLAALRTLPRDVSADTSLPSVFRSEAWALRLLNAQLASWAELRHDTLLYAKQSYTMMASCEFPDVYVDPYPETWAAIADFARLGGELLGGDGPDVAAYFENLATIATRLQGMAQRQLDGLPLESDDLVWANDMVRVHNEIVGCAPEASADGWYTTLFYGSVDPLEFDPTIADIHTQPTDAAGNMVGRVLHVGTGRPQTMVVTVMRDDGPRAYVGVVSSYYEVVTDGFTRLSDLDWSGGRLDASPRPEWLGPLFD